MNDDELIRLAKEFTIAAHSSINQKRKYSGAPYQVHPERVAKILHGIEAEASVIAAAWMHDVLEDVAPTNPLYNHEAIQQLFGPRILQLVLEVTDVSCKADGNRARRKALDRAHLAKASPEGKTIKLADLIDNICDINVHDPHFAKRFRYEAILTLPILKEGNKVLYSRLESLLKFSY